MLRLKGRGRLIIVDGVLHDKIKCDLMGMGRELFISRCRIWPHFSGAKRSSSNLAGS